MRLYRKYINILKDGKMTSRLVIKRFEELYGYSPKKRTVYVNLSRALKDGVLTRDENGFYSINYNSPRLIYTEIGGFSPRGEDSQKYGEK